MTGALATRRHRPPRRENHATPFARDLGDRLRRVREQNGMTLLDVERESKGKWPASVVGSWERGGRNPTTSRLNDLCRWYGIPLRDILDPSPNVAAAFAAITGAARSGVIRQIRDQLIEEAEDPRWDEGDILVIAAMAEKIGGPM